MDITKLQLNLESVLVGLSGIGLFYIHGILSEFRELVRVKSEMKNDIVKIGTEVIHLKERLDRLVEK